MPFPDIGIAGRRTATDEYDQIFVDMHVTDVGYVVPMSLQQLAGGFGMSLASGHRENVDVTAPGVVYERSE